MKMNSKEALNNIEKLFIGSPINPIQQIEIIKKDLEVLDIIKNKDVRIRVLLASKNVEEYNYSILFEIQHLTQEEFDLLKEWLSNE